MVAQDESIQYSARAKIKWWYWSLLILGSVMVISGTVWMIYSYRTIG